ncbi:heme-dependent oxidative N-demethylase subunit alpha family protein [Paracoccus cavernae]
MALRERLIAEREDAVHRLSVGARAAADELYAMVLRGLPARGYEIGPRGMIRRPDGVEVRADPAQPLLTLGRLVAEDLCLMQEVPEGSEGRASIFWVGRSCAFRRAGRWRRNSGGR